MWVQALVLEPREGGQTVHLQALLLLLLRMVLAALRLVGALWLPPPLLLRLTLSSPRKRSTSASASESRTHQRM